MYCEFLKNVCSIIILLFCYNITIIHFTVELWLYVCKETLVYHNILCTFMLLLLIKYSFHIKTRLIFCLHVLQIVKKNTKYYNVIM